MDAATYGHVTYDAAGNGYQVGYCDKPYYTASVPGLQQDYSNPQGSRVYPDAIFVGGFSKDTSELALQKLFTQHGKIREVKIVRDENKYSKGYGFIKFDNEQDAAKVLKTAESFGGKLEFNGSKINVAQAVRRQQFQPPFVPADYLLATPRGRLLAQTPAGNQYEIPAPIMAPPPNTNLNNNTISPAQMQYFSMTNGAVNVQQQQGQCGCFETASGDGTLGMRSFQDSQNQSMDYQTPFNGASSPSYQTPVPQHEVASNTQQVSRRDQQPLTPVTPVSGNQFTMPQLGYAQMIPSADMVHYSPMTYPFVYTLNNFQQYSVPGGFMYPVVTPSGSTANSYDAYFHQSYSDVAPRNFGNSEFHRPNFSRNNSTKSSVGQMNRSGQRNASYGGNDRRKSPHKGQRRQN